jgi:hypothetical protein
VKYAARWLGIVALSLLIALGVAIVTEALGVDVVRLAE